MVEKIKTREKILKKVRPEFWAKKTAYVLSEQHKKIAKFKKYEGKKVSIFHGRACRFPGKIFTKPSYFFNFAFPR